MPKITVTFSGGPLDGMQRTETVPEHWAVLRLEKQIQNRLYVYYGDIDQQRRQSALQYQGVGLFDGSDKQKESHK